MSACILLIEDDPALLTMLQATLEYGGFRSESVGSGCEAIAAFGARSFDLVLIDLGLPDLDGGEVLQTLRATSDVPILIVSGRGTERDKVEALDHGADDFIAKPFLPGELLARVRAALRRYRTPREVPAEDPNDGRDPIQIGALTLDPFHRSVELHGRKTVLSEAEYKVLKRLATSGEGVVSKAALLQTLYDSKALAETRIVEVYISNIRRKLRRLHECELILNFRGRGWKLIVPED